MGGPPPAPGGGWGGRGWGGWGMGPRRGPGEGCCLGPAMCCGPMLLLALPMTLGMAALHPVRAVRLIRAQAAEIRRAERKAQARP
jgi:hypothetical protein